MKLATTVESVKTAKIDDLVSDEEGMDEEGFSGL